MPESSDPHNGESSKQVTYPDLGGNLTRQGSPEPSKSEKKPQNKDESTSKSNRSDHTIPTSSASQKGKSRVAAVEDASDLERKGLPGPAKNDGDGQIPMGTEEKLSEDEASDVEKATTYTRKQQQAIRDVLRCGKKDYYGILGLDEDCSSSQITKAYRRLSLKIHTDKNKFKDAGKAFRRISEAYQVLISPHERKSFDRLRDRYKAEGLIDPEEIWDEEFHANASGDETSQSEVEEDPYPTPTKEILDIYDKATPAVNSYLADQNKESETQIEKLNEEIKQENRTSKKPENAFLIQLSLFKTQAEFVRPLIQQLADQPNNKKGLKRLDNAMKEFTRVKDRFDYPRAWRLDVPVELEKRMEQRAWDKGKTADARKSPSGPSGHKWGKPAKDKDRKGSTQTRSNEKDDSGSEMEWEPSPRDLERRDWQPGETRKGEKIVGYLPRYRTNLKTGEKDLYGVQFVVEKKGQPNPIALMSGEEAGRRVTQAYLSLPESEKNDLRYTGQKYGIKDIRSFVEIDGWADKPFQTKSLDSNRVYTSAIGRVVWKDGTKHYMNRQAMRNILGRKDADNEIQEFHQRLGLTPKWEEGPLAWRTQRQLTGGNTMRRLGKSDRHLTYRDNNSDRESETSSDSDSDSDTDLHESYHQFRRARKERQKRRKQPKKKQRYQRRQIEPGDDMDMERLVREVIRRLDIRA
ncbi:hypothetical protein Plec18170_009714 [Paecilomyces lecythidis]